MQKRIALADCNNFFVSCERIFDPKLLGKPVVVLSNNDGCVIARSNEAKKIGIAMGAPAFMCKEIFEQYNVIVRSSNFALYTDMSSRVMRILAEYVADIEVYSVDEAFFNFFPHALPDDQPTFTHHAAWIKKELWRKIGLPMSIGIGPTKTLAKIANLIAKKCPEYEGVFDITQHPEKERILQRIAVGDIWGVGRRYAKMLQRSGIENAYQLTNCSDEWIRKHMSIIGLKMVTELRGVACNGIADEQADAKKTISVSRSFGKVILEQQELNQAVAYHMGNAATKLRKQGSLTKSITVFACSALPGEHRKTYHTYSVTLEIPSAFTPALIAAAQRCVEKLYKRGIRYKKVGVILQDFYPADAVQLMTIGPTPAHEKQSTVMKAVDSINTRLGKNTISFAAAAGEQKWKAKTEKKSPAYTTNWHELLTIKI